MLGRALSTAKGAALTAVGLMIFAPQIVVGILQPHLGSPEVIEQIRRFGTLGLLAYCFIILFTSLAEKAIYFRPSEVNFLFAGPFNRRQLLWYKIAVQLLNVTVLAVLLTAITFKNTTSVFAAFLGVLLTLSFLNLFSVAVSLVGSNVSERANSTARKLALLLVSIALLTAAAGIGREFLVLSPLEIATRIEQSPVMRVILTPLRWFPGTFTAERIWPDLVFSASAALCVNVALLAVIFGLDAQYYEAAAATSAKVYARIQRIRSGGGLGPTLELSTRRGKRQSLPMIAWLFGAGPVAWRQITTAQRDFARVLLVAFILAAMTLPALFAGAADPHVDPVTLALALQGTVLGATFFLTPLLPFDFRADFDRLAELKALPVSPTALVAGQLAAPVLVMTLSQTLVMVVIGTKLSDTSWAWLFAVLAAFVVPVNLFQVGIDNVFFLLYPARPITGGTFDLEAMGRVMVLIFVKAIIVCCTGALAVGCGFVAYYVLGQNMKAGYVFSLVVMTALSLIPIPVAAWALVRLDVARDVPQS
jgi:hypothetical protein